MAAFHETIFTLVTSCTSEQKENVHSRAALVVKDRKESVTPSRRGTLACQLPSPSDPQALSSSGKKLISTYIYCGVTRFMALWHLWKAVLHFNGSMNIWRLQRRLFKMVLGHNMSIKSSKDTSAVSEGFVYHGAQASSTISPVTSSTLTFCQIGTL